MVDGRATGIKATELMQLAFEKWADRDGHDGLRDAWLASRDFSASPDWLSRPVRCNLCDKSTTLVIRPGADSTNPDMRESVLCALCRCNARMRAALGLLTARTRGNFFSRPRVYITEQVTPTYIWMQRNLRFKLFGSEFEPDASKRKSLTKTMRRMGGKGRVDFQNVTRLGFATGSLDAVVSFDVLEHVPDYRAAIHEFARVLRPGGSCIATFPFRDTPDTLTRARIGERGEVEHLLEPEFHGDPISGGVLCFYHFGWDVLDEFRTAGFRHARMVMPYSQDHGLLFGLWTLVAER